MNKKDFDKRFKAIISKVEGLEYISISDLANDGPITAIALELEEFKDECIGELFGDI